MLEVNNRLIEINVLLGELIKDKRVLIKNKHSYNLLCIMLFGLDVKFDTGKGNCFYIIELLENK